MARRTHGPKRNAEKFAYREVLDAPYEPDEVRQVAIRAWLAGYRAAARARRVDLYDGPNDPRK